MSNPNFSVFLGAIYCSLLICVLVGSGFLVAYTALPPDPSRHWLLVAGFSLGCLPWALWILTFLYRIVSRFFGFRIVLCCCVDGGGGDDGHAPHPPPPGNEACSNVESDRPPTAAVEVREEGQPNGASGAGGAGMEASTSGLDNVSVVSHESEIPFTLSSGAPS